MNMLKSFRRFAVIGPNQPDAPDVLRLQKLEADLPQVQELGIPEPVEYGWCGGSHIEDSEFSFRNNVFNDCLLFALRIDTNKVPAAIATAYRLQAEQLAAKDNPSGFISKKQKAECKDEVRKRLDDELRTGKHRRSKLVPVLWDLAEHVVYANGSESDQDKLREIFLRTFNLELHPLSAGSLACQFLEPLGKRRDYEDLKPTRFVYGPGGDSQWPDYPWVMRGPEPKDFLGNEFVLWLWHHADNGSGVIRIGEGDATVMFDKSIDLDCAYGETGKDTFRGVGVANMPEAHKALLSGKAPRKAGIILDHQGAGYHFTLRAETMAISALQLPEVEEADSPRTLLEEQITQLRDFTKSFDALYQCFLQERISPAWQQKRDQIRTWIQKVGK